MCPVCKGRGWYGYDVPVGHPLFSRTVSCDCRRSQRELYLRQICGLPGELQEWTFANTRPAPAARAAFEAAQTAAQQPRWLFTVQGPYGVGKTRLLACLVNAGRAAGWESVYTSAAGMLDYLRAAFAPKAEVGYEGRMELLQSARVLCIDEFDRWNPTPWAEEKFFQIIESRYEDGQNHLTAFATNAALDDLPGYVVSRMRDRRSQVHTIAGVDIRQVRR